MVRHFSKSSDQLLLHEQHKFICPNSLQGLHCRRSRALSRSRHIERRERPQWWSTQSFADAGIITQFWGEREYATLPTNAEPAESWSEKI